MGGTPKGLLRHPEGGTIVQHLASVLGEVGAEVVLVGAGDAYEGWPRVDDAYEGIGPLGGLCGLLRRADDAALVVACDMPFVTASDLRALLDARGDHLAVAPTRDGYFEPLCALYDARALVVAERRASAGQRSMQGLLRALEAHSVALPPDHLDDWDAPEDVTAR